MSPIQPSGRERVGLGIGSSSVVPLSWGPGPLARLVRRGLQEGRRDATRNPACVIGFWVVAGPSDVEKH